jgi:DNA gyrase subunit A
MKQYLLVITEDGYGKRVAVDEIRHTRRDAVGVKISRVSIAFAQVVDDANAELVIATAHGKIQRLRVGDVPTRRRRDQSSSRISKGVRIMRLEPNDRVATAAPVYRV